MAISIVLLSICAVVLFFQVPRSRYGLPLFFMTVGMILATSSILFQYYSSSAYMPPVFLPLRGVDVMLYKYINRQLRFPMPYMQYLRNVGIVIYMLGTAVFKDVIKRNLRLEGIQSIRWKAVMRKLLYLLFCVFYLLFYSPNHAYHIYLYMHSLSAEKQTPYMRLLTASNTAVSITVLLLIFYPVIYLIYLSLKKKITCFSSTLIRIICSLGSINVFFFITFFYGVFRNKAEDVVSGGFWFVNGIVRIPNIYMVVYPVFSIAILVFVVLNINRFFSIDLLFSSQQRTLTKRIDELNRNLKDVFHSEKNLMFSVQILANEVRNAYGTEEGLKKLDRIIEISSEQMNLISDSLNRIKELHIKSNATDLRELTDKALNSISVPDSVQIEKEYCSFPALCSIDSYHTTKAIVNLLMNSLEALAMSQQPDKKITISIGASKDWVYLSVRDNGPGMERKSIKKMLMPFVSTKSKTGNWGIGLPYVFRVINSQLGQLNIKSSVKESNHYTQVEILLPRYRRNQHE